MTRFAVSAIQDPKPIGRSFATSAWRLRTADGQTMYVTKVNRLSEPSPQTTATGKHEARRPAPDGGHEEVTDCGLQGRNLLYETFCRQLQFLLNSTREMKPGEVGDALGIVQTQARDWLARAEVEGLIRKTSEKPIRFGLRPTSLI